MIYLAFIVIVLLFGFVLLFGAPYLPTRRKQAQVALDMLELEQGQVLYELGCGDGRVLKQAAERGIRAVGYELNPLLAFVARVHTWKYRKSVKIICADFWRADLSKADGVFVFLLDRFMERLDTKMSTEVNKRVLLVSYAFKIPGKRILKTDNGMFLYKYDTKPLADKR